MVSYLYFYFMAGSTATVTDDRFKNVSFSFYNSANTTAACNFTWKIDSTVYDSSNYAFISNCSSDNTANTVLQSFDTATIIVNQTSWGTLTTSTLLSYLTSIGISTTQTEINNKISTATIRGNKIDLTQISGSIYADQFIVFNFDSAIDPSYVTGVAAIYNGVTSVTNNITLKKYYSPDKKHYIFNNSAYSSSASNVGNTSYFNLTIAYNGQNYFNKSYSTNAYINNFVGVPLSIIVSQPLASNTTNPIVQTTVDATYFFQLPANGTSCTTYSDLYVNATNAFNNTANIVYRSDNAVQTAYDSSNNTVCYIRFNCNSNLCNVGSQMLIVNNGTASSKQATTLYDFTLTPLQMQRAQTIYTQTQSGAFNITYAIANDLLISSTSLNNISNGSIAAIVIGSVAFIYFVVLIIIALINALCYAVPVSMPYPMAQPVPVEMGQVQVM